MPAGVDLTRPRILLRAGDVPMVQSRLEREPYRTLMDEVARRIRQADGVDLDDHTIAAERNKARAAKNLAFPYAIDRTVVRGSRGAVPGPGRARRRGGACPRAPAHHVHRAADSPCRHRSAASIATSTRRRSCSSMRRRTTRCAAPATTSAPTTRRSSTIWSTLASELYENYVDPASAFGLRHPAPEQPPLEERRRAGGRRASRLPSTRPTRGSDPRGVREPAAWFAYGSTRVDVVMRYVLVSGDGAYGEGPFYLRYASQNLLPFWRAWDRLAGGAPYRVGGHRHARASGAIRCSRARCSGRST